MQVVMKIPKVYVTAPGKVILFGEHSVVYGRKAIAASVDKRMKVKLYNHDKVELELQNLKCTKHWDLDEINSLFISFKDCICEEEKEPMKFNKKLVAMMKDFLKISNEAECTQTEKSVLAFLYLLAVIHHNKPVSGMRVEVHSSIPVASGLGSSAAYLVAVAGTLLADAGVLMCASHGDDLNATLGEEDLRLINAHAFAAEHIFHGKPSGLDNMVSTYGNVLVYSKCYSFKLCSNLPETKLVIVDTNVTRSTKDLMEKVRQKMEKYPAIVERVFDTMHHVAEAAEVVFGDLSGLEAMDERSRSILDDLVDMNQLFLDSIGAGHPRIDEVVFILRKFSIHGKLTGAGGGGSVVGLMPPDLPAESMTRMTEALQSLGFTCHFTVLGTQGVTLKKSC